MHIIAALVSLALLGFAIALIGFMLFGAREKIIAALMGEAQLNQQRARQPLILRPANDDGKCALGLAGQAA